MIDIIIIFLGIVSLFVIVILNTFSTKKETNKKLEDLMKNTKVEFINDEFVLINDNVIENIQQNFKDKIQYYDKDIELLDESVVEHQIENFRERISNDYGVIELLDEYTIQKVIENIRNQIQYKEFESLSNLGDELNKTVQKMLDKYIQEFNTEQKQFNTKLNSKSIYSIVEDKYIDLLEKEIHECKFDNNIVKYIGNIIIHINLQNSSEFWYIDIKKNNTSIKYGFSLNQKKRIQNIVAYIKFSNGFELTREEQKSFKYIKEKVNNEN
jgi:hypothetical protein